MALQEPAEEGDRQQRGHAEGDPPERRHVGGGPGGHDQEGDGAAHVHRRQREAVGGVGTPPAPPQPGDHDDEEHGVERRLHAGQDVRHVRVALDQPQVLRAVVAGQLRGPENSSGGMAPTVNSA